MHKEAASLSEIVDLLKGVGSTSNIPSPLFPKDMLKICCIGKIHAGKSTLLNQIIGADLLPTGNALDNLTTSPTFIYKGATEQIQIIQPDGKNKSFVGDGNWGKASKYLCSLNKKRCPYIHIELPRSSQIPGGVLFIDTPGLEGSQWSEYKTQEEFEILKANHWALSFADIALFCSSYRELCTQENDILQSYNLRKLLVISHCDLYFNEEDDKEALYVYKGNHTQICDALRDFKKLVERRSYSKTVQERIKALGDSLEDELWNFQKKFSKRLITDFCALHKESFQEVYFVSPFWEPSKINVLAEIGQDSLAELKKKIISFASKLKGQNECFEQDALLTFIARAIDKLAIENPCLEMDKENVMPELSYARKTGIFSKKLMEDLKKVIKSHS